MDGNRFTTAYPDGTMVSNLYTGRSQISTIFANGAPALANYTYDLNGSRLTKSLENGTSTTNAFDAASRLTFMNNLGTNGASFASFAYGFDSVNRKTYVKRDGSLGDVYKYDGTDQVTNVLYNATNPDSSPSSPSRTVGYAHDATGNRTSVIDGSTTSYTANDLNQYTAVGGLSPTYDSNGNLATYNGWSYFYDAQNRLTSAVGGSVTNSFSYDGRNRCVKRVAAGVSTYLYFDNWNLIEERNAAGTELANYVHGAMVDELLVKNVSAPVYYHHDSLGNVTALTDATGAVVEKYLYDIYGAPIFYNGNGTPIGSTAYGNRFLFTGREYLSDIGLYDYRNRFYSAELGRFLQADPIGFNAGDINFYRYCGNGIVNFKDPLGLFCKPLNKKEKKRLLKIFQGFRGKGLGKLADKLTQMLNENKIIFDTNIDSGGENGKTDRLFGSDFINLSESLFALSDKEIGETVAHEFVHTEQFATLNGKVVFTALDVFTDVGLLVGQSAAWALGYGFDTGEISEFHSQIPSESMAYSFQTLVN